MFMDSGLLNKIKGLEKSATKQAVEKRLEEFRMLGKKGSREWFSELCFCILTANSKAETAVKIQEELGSSGFLSAPAEKVKQCIMKHKHRFHNNKTKYIVEARKYSAIKEKVLSEKNPREWAAENIKGIGYKEASHFLRNVGYEGYAILDRHILKVMKENNSIKEIPKLNKKTYLETEKLFLNLAEASGISPAKLDLYMWSMRTGKVLK